MDEVGWMFNGQPALSEQAQRALELKGDLPLRLVDPRLQLSLNVDDWTSFEYLWCRRKMAFSQTASIGAVAAQFPQIALFGPTTRTTLAFVKRLTFMNLNGAAQPINFGLNFAGAGGVGAGVQAFVQDDRARNSRSACTIGQGNAAAQLITTANCGLRSIVLAAGAVLSLDVNYVLTGQLNVGGLFIANMFIEGATVNQALQVSIEWQERALSSAEIS